MLHFYAYNNSQKTISTNQRPSSREVYFDVTFLCIYNSQKTISTNQISYQRMDNYISNGDLFLVGMVTTNSSN